MINNKSKLTTYDRYGVENIRQCEEFANIIRPNKDSQSYIDFNELINNKVSQAMSWLSDKDIEYTWNEWIDNHLYRLYIPAKNLLLDFEFYPVNNMNYNYIRINYDTNIIDLLGKLFPSKIINTQETQLYILTQKATNKFLRENNKSPIYDSNVFRTGLVRYGELYQCIILKNNRIITNVTKNNCAVVQGTYMILRYLTEQLEIPEVIIKTNLDNSYQISLYELLNLPILSSTCKKKIWWNKDRPKWHISAEEKDNYIPFYFTESITYSYIRKP